LNEERGTKEGSHQGKWESFFSSFPDSLDACLKVARFNRNPVFRFRLPDGNGKHAEGISAQLGEVN
jgi:hypothetical protein